MGLYNLKTSKITKIHGIPLLHEGYFRKITKEVKRGQSGKKSGKQVAKIYRLRNFAGCENFAACKILQVAKFFATLQNFVVAHFLMFSALLSFGF